VITRQLIVDRDNGWCRRCGRTGEQIHHRKPRGMGGTRDSDINSPANLVLLCSGCHSWIELNREWAYKLGWLVHRTADPADIPVQTGHWSVRLLPDGGIEYGA